MYPSITHRHDLPPRPRPRPPAEDPCVSVLGSLHRPDARSSLTAPVTTSGSAAAYAVILFASIVAARARSANKTALDLSSARNQSREVPPGSSLGYGRACEPTSASDASRSSRSASRQVGGPRDKSSNAAAWDRGGSSNAESDGAGSILGETDTLSSPSSSPSSTPSSPSPSSGSSSATTRLFAARLLSKNGMLRRG